MQKQKLCTNYAVSKKVFILCLDANFFQEITARLDEALEAFLATSFFLKPKRIEVFVKKTEKDSVLRVEALLDLENR